MENIQIERVTNGWIIHAQKNAGYKNTEDSTYVCETKASLLKTLDQLIQVGEK